MTNSELHVFEKEGKIIKFKFRELSGLDRQYVQAAYSKAFRDAITSGLQLRAAVDKMLEAQGLLDRTADQEKITQFGKELRQMEICLRRAKNADGSKMTKQQGRELAIKMKQKRESIGDVASSTSSYYNDTAESKAFGSQIEATMYCCTQNEKGEPFWASEEDMRNDKLSREFVDEKFIKFITKTDSDKDTEDYEVSWLKKHKFIDSEGRFINENGKLISMNGKLVDEKGRFINEQGKLIDTYGNPLNENGELDVEDGWGED